MQRLQLYIIISTLDLSVEPFDFGLKLSEEYRF